MDANISPRSRPSPAQSASDQPQFKCDVCATAFARREHLTRHIRSHTKEKPFRCQTCKKNFTRADILQRHQNAHSSDKQEKTTRKAFRACTACAAGRVRCSGGIPCSGCEKKGTDCNYAARKKSKPTSIQTSNEIDPDNLNPAMRDSGVTDLLPTAVLAEDEEIIGSQKVPPLPSEPISNSNNHLQPHLQSHTTVSETQWSAGWMERPDPFQYDQFANGGQNTEFGFGMEQRTGYQAYSSINWASPSSELCRDWDYQLTSLMDNSMPAAASAPFMVIANGMPDMSVAGQTNSWNPNLEVQMDFSTIPMNDHNSPQIQSSTNSGTAPTDSVAESEDLHTPTTILYIDNMGARGTMQRPRKKRRQSNVRDFGRVASLQGHGPRSNEAEMISTHAHDRENIPPQKVCWVTAELYTEMLQNLHIYYQGNGDTFDSAGFPGIALINHFCRLYFEQFHIGFPFLRKVPFRPDNDVWILILAVASVGARYWNPISTSNFRYTLCQFLQTVIEYMTRRVSQEKTSDYVMTPFLGGTTEDRLPIIQARILNVLLMVHSGTSGLMEIAVLEFTALVAASHRMKLLRPDMREWLTDTSNNPGSKQEWLQIQLQSRAGYMIWMLDFMFMLEFNQQLQLELADVQAPLPSLEDVWDSPSLDNASLPSKSITLSKALEILYTEKRLVQSASEFSRILLIQGICRQTLEVHKYYRNRMSAWTPSAEVQSQVEFASADLWPPSSPIMSKWRNSACDCLDILHWSANSKIAQSAGFEHPTVLHLHLARLIILSPTSPIRELASDLIGGVRFDPQKNNASFHVLQWAIRDQYKARLSLVHAASVFWYIRRYSCDSFTEPFAVYLSTLIIWAFSIATQFTKRQDNQRDLSTGANQHPSGEPRTNGSVSDEDSELEISFINLDRPCDDESVQTFVRVGHKLTANMVRIGDIRGDNAPRRILQEGIRLLSGGSDKSQQEEFRNGEIGIEVDSEPPWRITQSYVHSLQRLKAVMVSSSTDK